MERKQLRTIIKLYESHRVLWDSKHPEYYNKHKREYLWRKISAKLNIPPKEIKKKLTSLLGSYRREKSRERKSQILRSGQGNVYKSKWFAFSWFQFLTDRNIPMDTTDAITNDVIQPSSPKAEDGQFDSVMEPVTPLTSQREELPTRGPMSHTSTPDTVLPPLPIRKRRAVSYKTKKTSEEMLQDAYKILKQSTKPQTDNYASFGNYVANELRKYDKQSLPHVKKAILDTLYRADLGEFSSTHYNYTVE